MVRPHAMGEASLRHRRILVTAGPTYEPIDPVRFIGNRSSGKMGFAIAGRAAARGAHVVLISGPVALSTPAGVERRNVETAMEMKSELDRALGEDLSAMDALIMAAAVADFRPAHPSARKLKKGSAEPEAISLVKNPDLIAEIGARRSGMRPLLVAFALETGPDVDVLAYATRKLTQKKVDLVVANAAHEALGGELSRCAFVDAEGASPFVSGSKDDLAERILDRVAAMLSG